MNYQYNIRGWLTDINNINNLAESGQPQDLFAFKIGYNTITQAHAEVEPLYNGNIAQTFWRTASDNIKRSYGYVYDHLNRLRDAYYKIPYSSVNNSYNEHLSYDSNGNILSLTRNGKEETDLYVLEIDELVYDYDDGNKLLNVTDATTYSEGFNDGNKHGVTMENDFEYDEYGNLIKDRNKNIDEITYNHLNLPKKIVFENNDEIEYLYDANGVKLRKKVKTGAITRTTHYIGGFQYSEDKMDFIPTAEGYVNVTQGTLSPTYNYVYNYTDHLGNIRLRYTKNPVNQWLEILEEDHYYPFGLKHQGYNAENYVFASLGDGPVQLIPTNPDALETYKYKFNGMELQSEMGLDYYDFGMRNYDPALGRWMNMDPLAEQGRRWTPYNYAFNNPVYWIDPDGMWPKNPLQLLKQKVNSTVNTVKQNIKNTVNDLKSSFYVDANATVSIGVQGGVKTPFGSLAAGIITSDVVTVGINNKEGSYVKEGDGKGHNFIEGSVKAVDNKLSLQGRVDYVTKDAAPSDGSDLLEYYQNNGELITTFGVGVEGIGKDSTGSIDTGSSANINSDCKCLEIEAGGKFIFGVDIKLNIGFKKEEEDTKKTTKLK